MPSYVDLLNETMMFTSNASPVRIASSASQNVFAPDPKLGSGLPLATYEMAACWSWDHDAAAPHEFKDVSCRVRGMGMNYKMPMSVCKRIAFENTFVETVDGKRIDLPLTNAFLIEKFFANSGTVSESNTGFWQLFSLLDSSMLLVFGYKVVDGTPTAITRAEAVELGTKFMPSEGAKQVDCPVDQTVKVVTCPLRILVCVSLTCCKERADYAPGNVMSVNRFYPHVMIMASHALKSVSADVVIVRNATTPHAGPMVDDQYSDGAPDFTPGGPFAKPVDHMLANIGPGFWTDSNEPLFPDYLNESTVSFPFWNDIFDYYDTDPLASGTGVGTPVKMVDAAKNFERSAEVLKLVVKGQKGDPTAGPEAVLTKFKKVARQGEFDNLHIAPKMSMGPVLAGIPTMKTSPIAMAPVCLHDCFHFHTRWGSLLPKKPQLGFDSTGTPYRKKLAPHVPHNQTISVTLLPPAGFRYNALASTEGPIPAGSWTVVFHHGAAYANEIVAPADLLATRLAVEAQALERDEHEFKSRSASNSWSTLYWRLRYGGLQDAPMERIIAVNSLKKLRLA
jgi:hypothetical protein